jgi:hypothetical protein
MARLSKVGRCAQRIATVLEKIVNQGLFVVTIELGGDNVIEKRSEVCI